MKTPQPTPGAWQQSQAGTKPALYQPGRCRACALAALALSASACASPAPTSATGPAGAAVQRQPQAGAALVPTAPAVTAPRPAWRIIVKFRPGVAYRDGAFLQAMGESLQARLVYLASVSADTHVYRIEPRSSLSEAEMVRRVASLPAVRHAQSDGRVRPL